MSYKHGWRILLFVVFCLLTGLVSGSDVLGNSETVLPSEAKTVTFGAVGDIMLSRNVAAKIKKANDPLLPFRQVEELLLSTDFNFGNLESPFSGRDKFNSSPTLVFNAPRANVQGLREYNFKVLSLANNHALDQGIKGLQYTKDYLAQNNIQGVGLGNNLDQAWQPAVVETNGIKVGFIAVSYASLNDNGKKRNSYVARWEDVPRLRQAVANLRPRVDFVVVSMHGGTEYTYKPNAAQRTFAHAAIDAGADMVIGHHPHWLQQIEQYQGKYIFYSLGNFIFDQEWSRQTKEGLALSVSLSKASGGSPALLSKVEVTPLVIENYSTPRLATPEESAAIFRHIGLSSQVLFP